MLARLYAGERELAAHLGLRCGDVLNYWFPVHDPALRHVSPGRLLLWRLIEERHGLRLIDRGEGDTPAKRDFATHATRFGRANWVAGTWRAAPARALQAALWRLAYPPPSPNTASAPQ
jgi:CelD/BcsL family acetyltransferase involved in cellulose biosynthesis